MSINLKSFAFTAVFSGACAGCVGGQVVEGSNSAPLDEAFDGAYMAYFLPRGELTATASYDPQSETITLSSTPKILPDLKHRESVLYRHSDMSNDEVTIEIDPNGLLKSVSTTTTDQTKEIVKAVAEVAQQFSTLQREVQKGQFSTFLEAPLGSKETPPLPPPPNCPKAAVQATFDLTYGSAGDHHKPTKPLTLKATPAVGDSRPEKEKSSETCELSISITDVNIGKKGAIPTQVSLPAAAYPATALYYQDQPRICPTNAVCFRTATGRELKISASLTRPRAKTLPAETVETVVAPGPHQGVLYFNRRAFVSNSTTASFTNGMLTKLVAKDPSAALGALQLSTEVLKSFTVLVKL
ncbi:hypothetical protein SR870_14335 [Rhodopseudomonas palustris]|uniref:hypothetical protein n=1 Tax=Rhodopseudomonas palustris TaxID=1076 RepID=UPI002ACEFB97|nr:hypothetical protein [Rhodopseudomonas palustris]WQG97887.1 hypothetical protein SR870_14335 [Rhodopseudomonas palustris]